MAPPKRVAKVPTFKAHISPRRGSGLPPPKPSAAGAIFDQNWTVGVAITPVDVAADFTGADSYAVQSGPLPTGVSLNASTGFITGTPTETVALRSIVIRGTNVSGFADTGFDVTVVSPPVGDADVFFGKLTLANSGGEALPAGATGITGGTAPGYTLLLGYVVPSSNGSAGDGTLQFNNGVTWTVATLAGEYSARTVSEIIAVNQLGSSTLNGKVLRLRQGTYNVHGTSWLATRGFATGFTVASHDGPAFIGVAGYGSEHDRVKLVIQDNGSQDSYNGCSKLKFDGLCMEAKFSRRIDNDNKFAFRVDGSITDIEFTRCWLRGNNFAIGAGTGYRGFVGGSWSTNGINGTTGLRIHQCLVSDMSRGFNLNTNGNKRITDTVFARYSGDALVFGDEGELEFTDNFIVNPTGDRTDVSFRPGSAGARASIGSSVTGVSDTATGLFHFRFRPSEGGTGVRRVIWAAQPQSGTQFAALELTAGNKIYFWAADAGGTKRVELTSTLSHYIPSASVGTTLQHNVLVSVSNTSGTNRMHVWIEGGSETTAAVTETVEQAATGHTLNWDCGDMSLAASNGSGSGTENYKGGLSRFAFWPTQSPDIRQASVRANLYDPTMTGVPKTTEAYAAFGTPPLDARGNLAEWRKTTSGGPVINSGSASQGFRLRTGTNTIDAYHIDVIQGIVNGGAGDGTNDGGGPIKVYRNVVYAHSFDELLPPGGQGFFFEDIKKGWVYQSPWFRNNLLVFAGPHGMSIYNPSDARLAHNTLIALSEMKTSNGDVGHTLKIRLDYHSIGGASTRHKTLATGFVRSNICQTVTIASDTLADMQSNGSVAIDFDNTIVPADTTSILGNYFKGSNGDGTGFDTMALTSIGAIKNMFMTKDSLNPVDCVKTGWDAYWGEATPYEGTCDDLTIPSRSGPGESVVLTPANVSAGGIAIYVDNEPNVEVQLLDAASTPVTGNWHGARALHLMPGQKFKVRRTTGTGTATVYFGDESATFQVT